jgi:hypothetical protein
MPFLLYTFGVFGVVMIGVVGVGIVVDCVGRLYELLILNAGNDVGDMIAGVALFTETKLLGTVAVEFVFRVVTLGFT